MLRQMLNLCCSWLMMTGFVCMAQVSVPLPPKGALEAVRIPAPSLKGSRLGIPTEQPAVVYLPPSYRTSQRRYPVIYFLHGFGDLLKFYTAYGVFQGFQLQPSLDALIAQGTMKEMIVVLPNGNTTLGGSFYVDSMAQGNWEQFLCKDLVAYVDGHYRTLTNRNSRAIAGHSMGGFGAIHQGLHHGDVFGAVYAMSPGLAMPGELRGHPAFSNPQSLAAVDALKTSLKKGPVQSAPKRLLAGMACLQALDDDAVFHVAYATTFAPESKGAVPFAGLDNWSRFETGFGNLEGKIVQGEASLRSLRLLALDAGEQDEYPWIVSGCRGFARLLEQRKIPCRLEVFKGGHGDKLRERLEQHLFPSLSDVMAFD